MRILVIKTSSLGDVIHTLPAITDAAQMRDDLIIDWVVEEAYKDIPLMHPEIENVIPVSIRRWRNNWLKNALELIRFILRLRRHSYDLIVDAQGLVKSGVIAWLAKGPVAGLDKKSARESVVSAIYVDKLNISRTMHAVDRVRRLFAYSLGYELVNEAPRFGLRSSSEVEKKVLFLHGTTWESKLWPQKYWIELASRMTLAGYDIVLTYGDENEKIRAESIAGNNEAVTVLPGMELKELAALISECSGVVSVDTGLGHLANALAKPLIALYGSTSPELTGMTGVNQKILVSDHLTCIPCLKRECGYFDDKQGVNDQMQVVQPPCFIPLTPLLVEQALFLLIKDRVEL